MRSYTFVGLLGSALAQMDGIHFEPSSGQSIDAPYAPAPLPIEEGESLRPLPSLAVEQTLHSFQYQAFTPLPPRTGQFLPVDQGRCPMPWVEACSSGGRWCYPGMVCPPCWARIDNRWDCFGYIPGAGCPYNWIDIRHPRANKCTYQQSPASCFPK